MPIGHGPRYDVVHLIIGRVQWLLLLLDEKRGTGMEGSRYTLKAVKFNHRSTWCCLVLIVPIVTPILMYIRDMAILHRIFIGCFIIMVAIIVASVSLVFFQTFMHRMGMDNEWEMESFTWLPMASHRTVFWRSLMRRPSSSLQIQAPTVSSSVHALQDWQSSTTSHPLVPPQDGYQQNVISHYAAVSLAAQELELNVNEEDRPPPYHEAVSVLASANSSQTPTHNTLVPNT